ncbi:MAG: hypothetical protein ABUS54_13415 [Actinomycetota bacterium]
MTFAIATLGAGWLMTYAGLSKSALELRRRRRICPSCGKHMRTAVCSSCV